MTSLPPRSNRRDVLKAAGLVGLGLALTPFVSYVRAAGEPKKKLLFFTKSSGFQHPMITRKDPKILSPAEQQLTELGDKNGYDVTCTKDGTIFTAEKLAAFDAFVFYTTGDLTKDSKDGSPNMSPEGKIAFLDAIKNGKGFVGFHSAADTFHGTGWKHSELLRAPEEVSTPDPYHVMLGGEFIMHGKQNEKVSLRVIDDKFPGAAGFKDVAFPEEWYSLKMFSKDLHAILVQDTTQMKDAAYKRNSYPETWLRMHGKGRVFYTSMGHRPDVWANDLFRTLIIGGLNWATGRIEADTTPNLETAAPNADVPVRDA